MNQKNYTTKAMVAIKNVETGRFSFVCEANKEIIKECQEMAHNWNVLSGRIEFTIVYFRAWIKNDKNKK